MFSPFSSALNHTRGIVLLAVLAAPARAQQPGTDVRNEVFVGSEMEAYLRVLQVGGRGGLYPWSLRGFSPAEVDRILPADSAHPWMEHHPLRPDSAEGARVSFVRPRAGVRYNTAFPYGENDGPIWAGRGLTTSLQAGIALRYGRLSATLAPMLFWAENREFPLQENGRTGRLRYGDALRSRYIDHPQRFGDGAYARVDPGQSTLRLDAGGVTTGVSTANQHWGPVRYQPIILGSNAPGFAHAFVGTARPLNVGIGRIHGRVVWGELRQSAFSSVPVDSGRRGMTGLVALFVPRGMPGVELGVTRFFHSDLTEGGTAELLRLPFEGFLKVNTPDPFDTIAVDQNQLASAFFRAAFPGSGVEVYGEYGREDHSWNLRDLLLEPDHSSAYVIGLGRVWRPASRRLFSLDLEVSNAHISHISKIRPQGVFYYHTKLRQGHTHQGQLLGSPAIYGGGGATVVGSYYHPGGRWTLGWRMVRQSEDVQRGRLARSGDAYHTLSAEALRLYGRWELIAGLAGVYNRNRYFEDDAMNLQFTFQVSSGF